MALRLKTVNRAIHEKWPLINLTEGSGYFYVTSEDDNIALQLARLYTTSIDVFRINHLSIEQWIEHVECILRDGYRISHERTPIKF